MAARRGKNGHTALAFQDDQALMTPGPLRDKLLDQIKQMGGKAIRANVEYSKTKGGTDLSALDGLVDASRARGLRVQATLLSDPSYAPPGGRLTYKNNDPKLWAQFAKTVAGRERGRISRYSVGNEMNYPAFMENADTNPRDAGRKYRDVYRDGRRAIKNIDPHAQVLFGELTNQPGTKEFLKGALGGKRLFTDGLAYHPYDAANGVWDTNNLGDLQHALAHDYKSKLQTAKGRSAPLYLTEYGKMRGGMPDDQRVAAVAAAFQRAKKAGARQFLQYQLTDKTGLTDGQQARDSYGDPVGLAPRKVAWDTSLGTAGGDLSTLAKALKQPRPKIKIRRKGV